MMVIAIAESTTVMATVRMRSEPRHRRARRLSQSRQSTRTMDGTYVTAPAR